MEAKAITRYARYSYRKVGQVLKIIANKRVSEAFNALMFVNKGTRTVVEKTLKSAVANSGRLKNPETVFVKKAWATMGPPIKRMRPGAQGRGNPYKRKTCHITIIVSDKKA